MENLIVWNDINKVKPEEGQEILYAYEYLRWDGERERTVKIGTYSHIEANNFPMCYMTYWTALPIPFAKEE